jgi:hypothetical protein
MTTPTAPTFDTVAMPRAAITEARRLAVLAKARRRATTSESSSIAAI